MGPLHGNRTGDGTTQPGFAIHIACVEILRHIEEQAPQVLRGIDDAKIAPQALIVDEGEERPGLHAHGIEQARCAKEQVHGIAERVAAHHPDPGGMPHAAACAVTTDQVSRIQTQVRAGGGIGDVSANAAVEHFIRIEFVPVEQAHVGEGSHARGEDRIEPVLRADLKILRAVNAGTLMPSGGPLNPTEFMRPKARDGDDVHGIVLRKRAVPDLVRNAPAPAELHGTGVDFVHLGHGDAAVALLDQGAGNAAPTQFNGEGEAHRAAADDQYGSGCCVHGFLL